MMESVLRDRFSFIDDGIYYVDPTWIARMYDFKFEVLKHSEKYKETNAQQYIHLSGTLFVRLIYDLNGYLLILLYENRRYIKDNELEEVAEKLYHQMKQFIEEPG